MYKLHATCGPTRFLLVLIVCFCVSDSKAIGQQTDPPQPLVPEAEQPTAPQPDPGAPFDLNDLETPPVDDLSLDSNQSYDFDDADSSQFASTSDSQSSIASNSEFRGASPQMMGDFGGGATIFNIDSLLSSPTGSPLTVQIPFAGGSRRIKASENNQVDPLDRVYGTYNYFDNAVVSGGPLGPVYSQGLSQFTMGIEKKLFENFSVDVRMPLIGIIDYTASNAGLSTNVRTSGVGNLSTSIKALLLQMEQTSVSGGLQLSIPTGSDARIVATSQFETLGIFVDNDALHLMPFIGVYREVGDSWWLQAFTQVDVPTNGNDVRFVRMAAPNDPDEVGRLNEQTLLYSDVSLGKWWYRNSGRGISGIASIFELHYTGSLNDADTLFMDNAITPSVAPENRFDALNLTMGLLVEFSERWRVNASGVVPLREREFEATGERREDRFFDGEFSLQINHFF